jgi:hypothetical protein
MDSAKRGPSRGHQLFEQWLIETYGGSRRRPGRPRFDGLRRAHALIAAQVAVLWPDDEIRQPPKSALGLYHWVASADDGGCRHTPRRYLREAIELVTKGRVPLESWGQPGVELVEQGAPTLPDAA